MTGMTATKMAEVAADAVAGAMRVARKLQQDLDALKSITKDDRSPVTIADFAAQAIVAHELIERLGDVRLVAEERAKALRDESHRAHLEATLDAVRTVWSDATPERMLAAIDAGAGEPLESFWTLDPIDGTLGFLRGGQYCISLSYIVRGAPEIGVLGCPNLSRDPSRPADVVDPDGALFVAIAGEGAYEVSSGRRRVQRDDVASGAPITLCESVEASHSDHGFSERVMAALGAPLNPPVRIDSQCKYACVARGQADAYLRLPTRKDYVERIWDHAAGALVATEAGCTVTDVDAKPLDFSLGRGLEKNRGVVVAAPSLHARLLDAISSASASLLAGRPAS